MAPQARGCGSGGLAFHALPLTAYLSRIMTPPATPTPGSPPGEIRLTERRNPRTTEIDLATSREIVAMLAAEDATVAQAVATAHEAIAQTIALAEDTFRRGGRLVYVGAGTSGRLGVLDASECPPTFGTPPEWVVGIIAGGPEALVRSREGVEDDVEAAAAAIDQARVGDGDLVIGIAASGVTPFVRSALARARARGTRTGLVCCADPPEDLAARCDVVICARTGPEAVTGSTRLKAGTATKMILNMITTGAMVRLGKTYGNLMVDLQATSAKLRDRGERIVREVTGVDPESARAAILAAGGRVRTAIVMIATNRSREEAERELARHDQRLRAILGDPPPIPR